MRESTLQNRCIEAIRARGGQAIPIGPPCENGSPDILGCYRSVTLALECKVKSGRVSKLQWYRLDEWSKAGAVARVVDQISQVKSILDGVDIRAGPI